MLIQGSQTLYITPGSPRQKPFIECLIGTLKVEALDRYLFGCLSGAQIILDHWMQEYNRLRPHSSLDYLTPVAYRQQ